MPKRATGKNLHVIPHNGGWAVRGEGSSRATSVHKSQREAIEAGREIARNRSSQLVIHARDGRVRERDSYNASSLPPKEPRKILYPEISAASTKAIKKAVREITQKTNGNSRNTAVN